jgi:hypothetical protein
MTTRPWAIRRGLRASAGLLAASLALLSGGQAGAPAASAQGAPTAVVYLDQGWSELDRDTFYTTEQGSHLMPLAWFKALRRVDADAAFGGDQLGRYGYLRNDSAANVNGLPVGFVVDDRSGPAQLGMTCAACHTGQVEYVKDGLTHAIRIDGAPASADFQQFLLDLGAAARATLEQPARFDAFAHAVLGTGYSPDAAAGLKTAFAAWSDQFAEFMSASLPAHPWGPGRLDAFGMIFNRVAARDLGQPGNFRKADAPVSYPFIWNAHRQDHTQWTGGVPNGLYLQAMARNTGEVFGVFADFKPKVVIPGGLFPTLVGYKDNSVDFDRLQALEEKVASLKPPPWPRDVFPIDQTLVNAGKPLFDQYCAQCHAERLSGAPGGAWATPVVAVGTDPKMAMNAARTSVSGLYEGARIPPPPLAERFGPNAPTTDVLKASVIGAMLDEAFLPVNPSSGVWRALNTDVASLNGGDRSDPKSFIQTQLTGLYAKQQADQPAAAAYESRVLYGIWATAPYLHNGSVPNLWELLTPPARRRTSFMVGSRLFDPRNVGFATDRSPSRTGRFKADPAVGDGNGGHDYGTHLTSAQRWALIEYLKTL